MVHEDSFYYGQRGLIYTVGFMFDHEKKVVLLIRKTHPEWQRGLLNGIGGKLGWDETPLSNMIRKGYEEGRILTEDWGHRLTIVEPKYHLHVFRAEVPRDVMFSAALESNMDGIDYERLEVHNINEIYAWDEFVPNSRWIIPFLLHDEYYTPATVLCDDSLIAGT